MHQKIGEHLPAHLCILQDSAAFCVGPPRPGRTTNRITLMWPHFLTLIRDNECSCLVNTALVAVPTNRCRFSGRQQHKARSLDLDDGLEHQYIGEFPHSRSSLSMGGDCVISGSCPSLRREHIVVTRCQRLVSLHSMSHVDDRYGTAYQAIVLSP